MDETVATREWHGRCKHAEQQKFVLSFFNAIWEVKGQFKESPCLHYFLLIKQ